MIKIRKEKSAEGVPPFKDFLDMTAPSILRFYADHFVCGNTYRSVWALREYPTSTDEKAILRHLGEKDGVTLRIYTRHVTPGEERRVITNAANRNKMSKSTTNDLRESVTAESNLQDVAALISAMHRSREPLLHCAVFIELTAPDFDALKLLQSEATTELVRSKLNIDRLLLRQREGFQSVMPPGHNAFGSQFERVLPASSCANLYPFNYSGKTDAGGFYIGRDKFGSNIIVDFDRRDSDKTNANVLILGNSGQGKSYLMKLILTNVLESGKSALCLDPEHEYAELTENLGGCFVDLMSGEYIINPLEPKNWDGDATENRAENRAESRVENRKPETENQSDKDGVRLAAGSLQSENEPPAFRQSTKLSQHISFLKDFFKSYKDFADRHIDALEIMLQKLYASRNITDSASFTRLKASDYPVLSELYALIQAELESAVNAERAGNTANTDGFTGSQLHGAELLRELLLGLHSMCVGAESRFFDGHTNITSARFIVFGVKGLLQASGNVRSALLFNVLSYMSDRLLNEGNAAASIDELYLFLTNPTAIEYIRAFMKRVRKKDSSVIIASQNLEDFNIEGIRELTKPLFSIPTHAFLFNAGNTDKRFYMDSLQLEESEYNLIRYPQRGVCLYKCGNERYNLAVEAPPHKARLFGTAGGK